MNFKKLTIMMALSVLSTTAFGSFLAEGGYLGAHNGKDKVNLLLKSAPGRTGSFFALLMKDEKRMSLYMVDPINGSSYAMTPLEVTEDGEIGVVNDDPSLIISGSVANKKGQTVFKIMDSGSSNNQGFGGFFEFSGKKSKFVWKKIEGGEYKAEERNSSKAKTALQISSLDPKEREATAVFLTHGLDGNFVLREKFPFMFLINQNTVLATGTQKAQIPKAIGVFLRSRRLGKDTIEMVLINPENDQDLTTFIQK